MNSCPNCGAEGIHGLPYCPSCGHDLVEAEVMEETVVRRPEDLAAHELALASVGLRAAARLVDLVVIVVAGTILAAVGGVSDDGTISVGAALTIAVFAALYEIMFVAWRGQTPGKIAVGIKIVTAETRLEHPNGSRSALRWFVPQVVGLFGLVPLLSVLSLLCYLSAAWDANKQGWHDKAARTMVVKLNS